MLLEGGRREDSRLRHRQGGGAGAAAGRPPARRRGWRASSRICRRSWCAARRSITARTSSRSASCCGRWSRDSGCSRARPTATRCATCCMQPIAEPSRRRDGIPAVLDAIVARALERDPARRYETAEAVRQRARSLPGRDADGAIRRSRSCSRSCSAARRRPSATTQTENPSGDLLRERRRRRPWLDARDGQPRRLSHHPAAAAAPDVDAHADRDLRAGRGGRRDRRPRAAAALAHRRAG